MSLAVAARAVSASRISSARCEGESESAMCAGFPLLARGLAGAAEEVAPAWTATASRAVTPAAATMWEVRLREELLLNTDSFETVADRATWGDHRDHSDHWGETVGLL